MLPFSFKYVHEDVDRHGNVRIYFWRKGQRKVRLREPPGSLAFVQRYHELLALSNRGELKLEIFRPSTIPGTWRWLCVQYFVSRTFGGLERSTQKVRRRILESTWDEPIFRALKKSSRIFPLAVLLLSPFESSEIAKRTCLRRL